MTIAVEKPFGEIIAEILLQNLRRNVGDKYIDFLLAVYKNVEEDKTLAECLEVCIAANSGPFPTIKRIEVELAKMDGGIRPLLEEKGIVEPMPKVGGVKW